MNLIKRSHLKTFNQGGPTEIKSYFYPLQKKKITVEEELSKTLKKKKRRKCW